MTLTAYEECEPFPEAWQPHSHLRRKQPEPDREIDVIDVRAPVPFDNPFRDPFGRVLKIIDSVASDFDMSHGELIGDGNARRRAMARSVVVRLLNERGYSYAEIGRRWLRRDHSTVIHSRQMFDTYVKLSPLVMQSYARHAELLAEVAR